MSIVMRVGIPKEYSDMSPEGIRRAIEYMMFTDQAVFNIVEDMDHKKLRVDPSTHRSISQLSDEHQVPMTVITANIIKAYAEMDQERMLKAMELTDEIRALGYDIELTGSCLKEADANA